LTPITWRNLTADYTEAERNTMRQLAATQPAEAAILHELKARLDATIVPDAAIAELIYVFAWGNNERRAQLKGRRCVVEATGRKNTVLVRFLDTGERVTTSRRAIRPVTERPRGTYEIPAGVTVEAWKPPEPKPDQLRIDAA